ncbi:MAG: ATP-binding protein [Caldilineaceae bacterium]
MIYCENPCPCGYYGDDGYPCRCSMSSMQRYRKRDSGRLPTSVLAPPATSLHHEGPQSETLP